jgi:hypothetical protein
LTNKIYSPNWPENLSTPTEVASVFDLGQEIETHHILKWRYPVLNGNEVTTKEGLHELYKRGYFRFKILYRQSPDQNWSDWLVLIWKRSFIYCYNLDKDSFFPYEVWYFVEPNLEMNICPLDGRYNTVETEPSYGWLVWDELGRPTV